MKSKLIKIILKHFERNLFIIVLKPTLTTKVVINNLPTDGLNIPNGNPTDSFLAKFSANAFVNVYVFGQPDVKL